MNLTVSPTELLKEYFFKALLIQHSTKMIDENWGENISEVFQFYISDPLNVSVQTDKDQVAFLITLWDIARYDPMEEYEVFAMFIGYHREKQRRNYPGCSFTNLLPFKRIVV